MSNALNWFEIPATNIKRAAKFYSTILDVDLEVLEPMPGFQMAMFPAEDGVGGDIV
jgi:predicted enzyme related to lactoylglutathione lyase